MLKTILIDDESVIRQGIKQLIPWEELGFRITDEAADGEEALARIKSTFYHLMITDISMPNMNGLELIRRVREINPGLKIIVLSGYNEFEYVKEAMKYQVENYLLKPVAEQELIDTLLNVKESITMQIEHHYLGSEHAQVLTNHLMNRFIKNKLSKIEFRNRANFLNIDIPNAPYYIAVIELNDFTTKYEGEPERIDYATFHACLNVAKELFMNHGITSILFEDDPHRIVCLFEQGNVTMTSEQVMEEILASIQAYVKTTATIAVSPPSHSLFQLHTIYLETAKLLDYTFFLGTNRIITSNSIPAISHISLNEDKWLEAYGKLIRSCHTLQTRQLIIDLFTKMMQDAVPSRTYIEYMAMKLILHSVAILKEYNGSLSFLYDGDTSLSQRLTAANSIDAIAEHVMELSSQVIHHLEQLQQSRPNKLIDKICGHIDQHFAKDITLKELGDLYYINPSYLGKLFRKSKGESFNDYVNKVRLANAKQLLTTSNQRIYQIAEAVGYKDYNYFCRVFKQQFGVLPSNLK